MVTLFFDLKFDIIHRAGVKDQALEALSRLETKVEDYLRLNDDIPSLLLTISRTKVEQGKLHHVLFVKYMAKKNKKPAI